MERHNKILTFWKIWHWLYFLMSNLEFLVIITLNCMYRSDLLYCDVTCDQFATKKWDDSFMKLSEKMNSHKMFKGLSINKEKPCFDPGSRPLINFKELKSLLIGKDFEAFETFKNKY